VKFSIIFFLLKKTLSKYLFDFFLNVNDLRGKKILWDRVFNIKEKLIFSSNQIKSKKKKNFFLFFIHQKLKIIN
jgi:hypothetical protein